MRHLGGNAFFDGVAGGLDHLQEVFFTGGGFMWIQFGVISDEDIRKIGVGCAEAFEDVAI